MVVSVASKLANVLPMIGKVENVSSEVPAEVRNVLVN